MGSPVTHKVFWELYTPKKEYIKFFEYSDNGYSEAIKFEGSLIKPVYKIDSLCLNEHCGGVLSPESSRRGGTTTYKRGVGIFSRSKEKKVEDGKKGGNTTYNRGVGTFARSKEQITKDSKKAGKVSYKRGAGFHALSKEERKKNGEKSGRSMVELKIGIHGLTEEEKTVNRKKGAAAQHGQRWQCTITGFVSTPTGIAKFQKNRGIDPSNRIRIK